MAPHVTIILIEERKKIHSRLIHLLSILSGGFPAIFLFLRVLVLLDLSWLFLTVHALLILYFSSTLYVCVHLVSHVSCVATRWILEQNKQLEPRRSALEDDFEEEEEKDEDEPLPTGLDDEHEKVDF